MSTRLVKISSRASKLSSLSICAPSKRKFLRTPSTFRHSKTWETWISRCSITNILKTSFRHTRRGFLLLIVTTLQKVIQRCSVKRRLTRRTSSPRSTRRWRNWIKIWLSVASVYRSVVHFSNPTLLTVLFRTWIQLWRRLTKLESQHLRSVNGVK